MASREWGRQLHGPSQHVRQPRDIPLLSLCVSTPVCAFQIPLYAVAASSCQPPAQQLDQDELEKADDMEAILFP